MTTLNLNIDHFATLRNARGGNEPNLLHAALEAELGGAAGIVAHLRKDRRHVNDNDIRLLKSAISTKLNLEMCTDDEIMKIAMEVKPTTSTLVPERENEITTEGGLDVVKHKKHIKTCVKKLHDAGIQVSLFIEPDYKQIEAAFEVKADAVELNTNQYSLAKDRESHIKEVIKIMYAADCALQHNLVIAAGHSINYINIQDLAVVHSIKEYNIGHAIVARSAFIGVRNAVKEMVDSILRTQLISQSFAITSMLNSKENDFEDD